MPKREKNKNKNKNKDSSPYKSDKARIRELEKENLSLRREIGQLKSEIERTKSSTRRLLKKTDSINKLFLRQARRENTFSQDAFFAYFKNSLKNASIFRVYADIVNTVKHFTFFTTAIQIFLFIFSVIKSGAVILISTSAFIVSLPFLLMISGTGAILTFLGTRKANEINKPLIKGKRVCVFFPAKRSAMSPDSYFAGFVRSTAEDRNTVCVIVTKGFFFSRGIYSNKRYFFTSRRDADNVIVIRRRYYFRFKQNIIIPESSSICEIY